MDARRCKTLTAILLIVVSGLAVAPRIALANEELMELQQDDGQWAQQSKDYSGTRYSTLSQITPENVKNLKVAWSFSLGTLNGQQGGPLVVGDTMYVHSSYSTSQSHNIFALDLSKEGAPIKWKYAAKHDPRAVPVACCDLVHLGLQYANGKILYQTLDGIVIALDARTGKELWKTRNADPSKGETNTGAGLVIKDKYIVGVAGGEFGVRGWIAAYDINTGKQIWKAHSTGPDEDLMLASDFNAANPHYGRFGEGTKSWPGEQWKSGGSTTWGYWSYDPELDLLYYSTGNPGIWNPAPRKGGDNKWSMTIWARNPDTGQAKWAYQMTPWDNWAYRGFNETILTEQTIDGKKRKVLTHFDGNGFVYVLDRTDGTLLSAEPFVYINWAKGIDRKTGRPIVNTEKLTKQGGDTKNICPTAMGAKSEQPTAYSPKTNLFYAPSNNVCMNYEGVLVHYTAGAPYVGANVLMFNGHEGRDNWWGEVIAWDAARGKRVWEIKEPFPVQSGPVVTASNVVFYGTMDGWLKAADARDGKLLWKHKVGSGIIGNPITYKGPDGKQYVAVYSGVGGWFGATVSLDLPKDDPTAALGAVNAAYLSGLPTATTKGGELVAFALEAYQRVAYEAPVEQPKIVSVFYGTDRNVTGDKDPALYYGEEKGSSLQFGICEVSIPSSHQIAKVESHWIRQLVKSRWIIRKLEDLGKHVVLVNVTPKDDQGFFGRLKQMITRSRKRDAFVFIHGYNATFEDSCRRTAQIAHDLKFQGAPIMYSWPSRGNTRDPTQYSAAESTIEWSTGNFERFIMMVAERTGAETVHLIAHSMGSRALVRALDSISKRGRLTRPLFNQVVLAAPDIDAGEFENLAAAVQKASERTTLYASSKDKCLKLSRRFHDFPRAGEAGANITVIKGIDTIDVSAVTTSVACLFDFLPSGHLYYAENRSVLTDLFELIGLRMPPLKRFNPRPHPWGYWEFQR